MIHWLVYLLNIVSNSFDPAFQFWFCFLLFYGEHEIIFNAFSFSLLFRLLIHAWRSQTMSEERSE